MEEREEKREGKRALMQESAATRAPMHYVRVESGPNINKLVHIYS